MKVVNFFWMSVKYYELRIKEGKHMENELYVNISL